LHNIPLDIEVDNTDVSIASTEIKTKNTITL